MCVCGGGGDRKEGNYEEERGNDEKERGWEGEGRGHEEERGIRGRRGMRR